MGNETLNKDLNKEIQWKMFGTGPAMIEAFLNKNLDIGYMGLPPAIIGIDKEVPIKCVAGGHVEGTVMVANKDYKTLFQLDNKISNVLSQFKGKALGVPSKGSIHDVILNFYLEQLFKYIPVSRNEVKAKKVKKQKPKTEDIEEYRTKAKKKVLLPWGNKTLKKNSAATYSPTKLPWQYHRR